MVVEEVGVVVIVGEVVVECFNLLKLVENIEDELNNMICFLVFGKYDVGLFGCDKILLIMLVLNCIGLLYELLLFFLYIGVFLFCLEFCLVCNVLWEYVFYVDVDGYCDDFVVNIVFDELVSCVVYLKIFGFYLVVVY